ncbi:FtsX-like permease family protein [Sagittula sp. NFXS13]|uniref:FtsX-like permease family protein n=1 Tax=Sagittula sp. NFXS13 TaxID=2819095 RepID=UPI0032DEFD2C
MIVLLLTPIVLVAVLLCRGYAPGPLVRALLWRYRLVNCLFGGLIAVALAMGIAVLAQERGLREGSAQAADGFDLVVGTPGSEMDLMLASVYLQPSRVGLLDGDRFASIAEDPRAQLAAPLAFGDSHDGAPVVGTVADFVTHLAHGAVQGRLFANTSEAVVGARSDLHIGDHFHPSHGHGHGADHDAHEGVEFEVVGRLPLTGTPWDQAVIVPIEAVWETHGLANGHGAEEGTRIGAPFDPALFPGTPAVVVVPRGMGAAYGLRTTLNQADDMMAILPGAVQAELYRLMGDARQAVTVLTSVTQGLVVLAVLVSLMILSRLFQRQLAMLRAVGAPMRFVLSVVWGHAAVLLSIGTVLGVLLGYGAAAVLSSVLTAHTGVHVPATLGVTELRLAAGFLSAAAVAALIPAWWAARTPVAEALRRN